MGKQYIIVDIKEQVFFKDQAGNVMKFNSIDDAKLHCGIYELENAWICEMLYNYIDK